MDAALTAEIRAAHAASKGTYGAPRLQIDLAEAGIRVSRKRVCDGHVRAFAFFGGVPKSILYDNTKLAVARILGDGKRQRTRVFTELQSH